VDAIWDDIMRPMAQFGRPATGVCLKPLTEALYHKAIAPRVPVCAARSNARPRRTALASNSFNAMRRAVVRRGVAAGGGRPVARFRRAAPRRAAPRHVQRPGSARQYPVLVVHYCLRCSP